MIKITATFYFIQIMIRLGSFEFLSLDIASNFEFRYSDLICSKRYLYLKKLFTIKSKNFTIP